MGSESYKSSHPSLAPCVVFSYHVGDKKKPVFIKSPGHRSSHPFSQILPQEVGTHPEDLLWLVARGGHGENRCVIRAFLECYITVAILNYWR